MIGQALEARIESSGISPWELEVAYGYLNSRFTVIQTEMQEPDPDFISVMSIFIPLPFSGDFFDWFGFGRWEKIKSLFKEMKKRRGSKNALKIRLVFAGSPSISFVIDAVDRHLYDNAVEKIDFVLELLPYHLNPDGIPHGATRLTYRYDEKSRRWGFGEAHAGQKRFTFSGGAWSAADSA